MRKTAYKTTDLICLNCGLIMTISRKEQKQKKVGHIKDMYCPCCKDMVKYYEVRDADIFKWQCENSNELTEQEQLIFNLLKEREEQNVKSEYRVYKKVLTRE